MALAAARPARPHHCNECRLHSTTMKITMMMMMMMMMIIIIIIIIIIILKMKITPEKMDMICILEIPTGKPARDAASTQWKTRI